MMTARLKTMPSPIYTPTYEVLRSVLELKRRCSKSPLGGRLARPFPSHSQELQSAPKHRRFLKLLESPGLVVAPKQSARMVQTARAVSSASGLVYPYSLEISRSGAVEATTPEKGTYS